MSKVIGERIRILRTLKNLTQKELAELSHVPQSTLSAMETNTENIRYTKERLKLIAEAFDINSEDLIIRSRFENLLQKFQQKENKNINKFSPIEMSVGPISYQIHIAISKEHEAHLPLLDKASKKAIQALLESHQFELEQNIRIEIDKEKENIENKLKEIRGVSLQFMGETPF